MGVVGGTVPEASYRRFVSAGLAIRPLPRGPRRGMAGCSAASASGSPAAAARRSGPSRAAEGGAFAPRAGSRPGDRGGVQPVRRRPGPARRARLEGAGPAALAYLAKHHTESTRAELVPILGLSRPESVPDLSSRFAAPLRTQAGVRRDLMAPELALKDRGENSKSV